jgi:hypothetical protein
MIISNTSIHEENSATYKALTITSAKTKYTFLKVTGKYNYVTVKNNNSPWRSLGKEFNSFDDAQMNYKNPKLKSMILVADSML